MSRAGLALALLACGCIESGLVPCGASVCPVGRVCTPAGCATPEAAAACANVATGEGCTTPDIANGTCVDGRCEAAACGNGVTDINELCDDGNLIAGDGCSTTCDSLETCGNGLVDLATDEECDSGAAGQSSDGCSSRCFVEPELWREVVPGTISPRTRAAVAYDSLNHMMLFGGLGDDGFLGDTWSWDAAWTRLDPVVAPSPRHSSAIAYDAVRSRVVLFGGFGSSGALGDTWEWDGVAWQERTTTGPTPRGAASAAYDLVRARFVMFGGRGDTGDLGDTWEWDGTSWQQITTATSPAPRSEHTMVFDDTNLRKVVMLYGGGARETWTYDGVDWTATAAAPVVLPDGARLIWNEELSQVELLGIESVSSEFLTAFEWTGTDWQLAADTTGAAARTHFGVTSDSSCGCVTLMLGANADSTLFYGDLWEFDSSSGDEWALIDESALSSPSPTIGHAMAFDTKRDQGVLVGGDGPGADYSRAWLWSQGQWTRANPFGKRSGHAIAYDAARDRVIVHGGFDLGLQVPVLDAKTLAWDGMTAWQTLAPAASPPRRTEHAMAYDAARERIVLFGGYDTAPRGDTWEWDGLSWTERTFTTSPPARERHAMAYDESRDRLVLFGGRDLNGQPLGDTWEYDGATWHDATPTSPSPSARLDHVMAYDPLRARVLLVGGDLFGTDTWEWNGAVWEPRAPANPPLDRLGGAMFYDTVSHQMVLFGGFGARYYRETYVRTFELAGQTDACVGADTDGDGLVGCSDPDCAGRVECR